MVSNLSLTNSTDAFSTSYTDTDFKSGTIYLNKSSDWDILFRDIKGPITIPGFCIGILTNLLALVVLAREANRLPRLMGRLLINQAFIDCIVCIFMINYIIKDGRQWMTGIFVVDVVICYTINSDMLYWSFAFISAQGLICIAGERYMAICKPFTYLKWKNSCLPSVVLCLFVYVYGTLVTLPYYLSIRFRNRVCLININSKQESGFFAVQPFIWLVTYYILPVTICAILYVYILRTLQRSMKLEKHSENKTVSQASVQLTKTGLTVTILFIICVGINTIPYVLVTIGFIDNDVIMHVIQLSCITLNSMVNPFIYVITMPFFKSSLKGLFCCSTLIRESTFSSN